MGVYAGILEETNVVMRIKASMSMREAMQTKSEEL
jgi:hypothetical protein